MPNQALNQELFEQLSALRGENGGRIDGEQIRQVVDSIMTSVESVEPEHDVRLYQELANLADFIHRTREEIAALRADEIKDDFIPKATDELDAVVGATEQATNTIMDQMERLEEIAGEIGGEAGDKITEITTEVFMACGFQDITGQRITKVVKTLKHIESKVEGLLAAVGEEVKQAARDVQAESGKRELTEEDLLNGPQSPDKAIKQEDIDKFFGS